MGMCAMGEHKVFRMGFAKIYDALLNKAVRKGCSKAEADEIICRLTGIKGAVCGVRVEEIEDPLMREVRCPDKLIDKLAKGKPMEKILRTPGGSRG